MNAASAIVVVVLVLFVLGAMVVDYRQELIASERDVKRLREDLAFAVLVMPEVLDGSTEAVTLARRWIEVMKRRSEVDASLVLAQRRRGAR